MQINNKEYKHANSKEQIILKDKFERNFIIQKLNLYSKINK